MRSTRRRRSKEESRLDRFQKVYKQGRGFTSKTEIWVDTQTGVNYLWHHDGYAGGLTVLLDENGKPVVTKI
ncbi:xylan 1,4-beta-xylosidase [bacterium 1xD42-67]|nr:xylan 1,4-beta-xylosidase [bacterium 1xD42-67]